MTSTQAMDLRDPERIERPAVLEMSFEEFIVWDHQGGLAEWVDGKVHLYMSNSDLHQRIVEFLHIFLDSYVRLHGGGAVKLAPYAMRAMPGGPAREPDITVVLERTRLGDLLLEGPADLVVEVVSDESVTRDFRDKYEEYEAAGIAEYWIVDSRPGREAAQFFVLSPDPAGRRERAYVPQPIESGRYYSSVLPGCWVNVRWLFDENASPLRCLAEVVGRERMAELLG
ncbi:MAG: Uma2 family endonuclease [Dehalococcoidia bacterium]|nr:Uma2 family endonuclease [Dehalococcoidia bacterium]